MLYLEKPVNLIVDGLTIVYNVFFTFETIYVISNNYFNKDDQRLINLEFKINDVQTKNINFFNKYYNHWEQVNFFQIQHNSKDYDKKLTVCYKDKEYDIYLTKQNFIYDKSFFIKNISYLTKQNFIYDKNNVIAMMTLFKDDYELLPTYISHYKKLGIKHFYFYYNYSYQQLIELKNISEILDNINSDNEINCTFIEWDHKYFEYVDGRTYHSSQCPAMFDMYYKAKHLFQYIYFNDLDEYLFFKDKDVNNFNEFIQKYNNIDIFQFNMYWSKYIIKNMMEVNSDGNLLISYSNFNKDFNLNNFVILEHHDETHKTQRSKMLLKTNLFGCGVHKETYKISTNESEEEIYLPYNNLNRLVLDGFYHITNILEKKRTENS
jgi:hypothetical protein